jgi:hypothetical protein
MNVCAANQPQAEYPLARLAGDPAKMIAAAPHRARQRLTPALLGVG